MIDPVHNPNDCRKNEGSNIVPRAEVVKERVDIDVFRETMLDSTNSNIGRHLSSVAKVWVIDMYQIGIATPLGVNYLYLNLSKTIAFLDAGHVSIPDMVYLIADTNVVAAIILLYPELSFIQVAP